MIFAVLALLPIVAQAAAATPPPPADQNIRVGTGISGALLGGLDKTTARVIKFVAPISQMVPYGTLQITVKDCRKRPPEETPESAAYIIIDELHAGESTPRHLFAGWMFASSPALSALEHPVYDVWVLDCSTSSASSPNAG